MKSNITIIGVIGGYPYAGNWTMVMVWVTAIGKVTYELGKTGMEPYYFCDQKL